MSRCFMTSKKYACVITLEALVFSKIFKFWRRNKKYMRRGKHLTVVFYFKFWRILKRRLLLHHHTIVDRGAIFSCNER